MMKKQNISIQHLKKVREVKPPGEKRTFKNYSLISIVIHGYDI